MVMPHKMDTIYCLSEAKPELVLGSAEPYFQSILYYIGHLEIQERGGQYLCLTLLPHFLLWCASLVTILCVYVIRKLPVSGASFGFVGMAHLIVPHVDILGPIIPLFYQRHDDDLRSTAAASLVLPKKCILSLKNYYEFELPRLLAHNRSYHRIHAFLTQHLQVTENPDLSNTSGYWEVCGSLGRVNGISAAGSVFAEAAEGIEELGVSSLSEDMERGAPALRPASIAPACTGSKRFMEDGI